MRPTCIKGVNKTYSAPDGWDEAKHGKCGTLFVMKHMDGELPVCSSAWLPTEEELAHLNAGGPIILHIYGGQPAVKLEAVAKAIGIEEGLAEQ